MAKKGFTPKLYGYTEVEGAPTAYIMEYLDPCAWQTLHQFLKSDATAVDRTQLQEASLKRSNPIIMFTVIFEATTS